MLYDEEGCFFRILQIIVLGLVATLIGLALSFYTYSELKTDPQEIFDKTPSVVKKVLRKANTFRKKYYLLPHEVRYLKEILNKKHVALLNERQFKEALIKQTLDDKPYIVISLNDNMLYLKQKDKILRKARVATGRNKTEILQGRAYTFFTPRTIFTVNSKIEDPVWIMPNWAFYEKGQALPADSSSRRVPGVLGKYALILGRGYMIHGTINPSDLGKYITHGCIRVGANDLKAIYEFVPAGTKVYIY